ncbi:MAG: hypothetical protein AAF901_13305 [Bacteroidota bacterium]
MQIATLTTIKKELQHLSHDELMALCLRLGRFKKENKALLTYLLFEAHDEAGYIESVKQTIDQEFKSINTASYFYMKKTIRKILRQIRTFNRYSLNKATEVELLLYFCEKLNAITPSIHNYRTLSNLYERQIESIKKKITALHEDLQYDYNQILNDIKH